MKKLLTTASAYVAFLLVPTVASPATIVEPYTVRLPVEAGPPLVLVSSDFQQFDPALGTLNDVQVTLTGTFRWLASGPGSGLAVGLDFGGIQVRTPPFPFDGVETFNLMATGTSPPELQFFTGTSSITGEVAFFFGSNPDVIAQGSARDLQGTVTYDYTPTVAAIPEPSTWAMVLIGFAGLGFAFRQSRRRGVVRLI
jgi:PEP-CTERM motif